MLTKTLLPLLRTSSLLLLPLAVACGAPEMTGEAPQDNPPAAGPGDPASPTDPTDPSNPAAPKQCVEQSSTLAFVETFNQAISGWTSRTAEPADAAHSWTLVRTPGEGQLVSDPGGAMSASYENEIISPAFSLKEATRGYVRFKTRFQQSGTFQLLMTDDSGRSVSLADFGAQNPSWPELDCVEAPIPKEFAGAAGVHLALRVVGGSQGGAGATVDNLRVAVRTCAPGSLPDGQAPPVLKARRKLSIGPCAAVEPPDDM